MYGYIYKVTNLINNKIYIGKKKSTIFLGQKYLGSGRLIRAAIHVYGKNNFTVSLLEECDSNENLNLKEQYWIQFYDSMNSDIGYNISCGGVENDLMTCKKDHSRYFSEEELQLIYKYNQMKKQKRLNKKLKNINSTPTMTIVPDKTDDEKSYIPFNFVANEDEYYIIHKQSEAKRVGAKDLDYWYQNGWALGWPESWL